MHLINTKILTFKKHGKKNFQTKVTFDIITVRENYDNNFRCSIVETDMHQVIFVSNSGYVLFPYFTSF